jgi:hypothetical protein
MTLNGLAYAVQASRLGATSLCDAGTHPFNQHIHNDCALLSALRAMLCLFCCPAGSTCSSCWTTWCHFMSARSRWRSCRSSWTRSRLRHRRPSSRGRCAALLFVLLYYVTPHRVCLQAQPAEFSAVGYHQGVALCAGVLSARSLLCVHF